MDESRDLADYDEPKELDMVFGGLESIKGGVNDLYAAAERTAKLAEKPRLYPFCGTEDFLYGSNTRFRDFISQLAYDYTYEESPGGHEWELWDRRIARFIRMLGLERAK